MVLKRVPCASAAKVAGIASGKVVCENVRRTAGDDPRAWPTGTDAILRRSGWFRVLWHRRLGRIEVVSELSSRADEDDQAWDRECSDRTNADAEMERKGMGADVGPHLFEWTIALRCAPPTNSCFAFLPYLEPLSPAASGIHRIDL